MTNQIPQKPQSNPTNVNIPIDQAVQLEIIRKFFEKTVNLFVILSIIGALISLLPSFLEVIIGKDWINLLLGTLPGFYTLTLLLIISYTGALFMFFTLLLIVKIFYREVLINEKCSKDNQFFYLMYMIIGVIAIGSLILFLVFSWIIRIDYAIKINILILILIFGYSILIGLLSFIFISLCKEYPSHKLDYTILFVILIGVILFLVTPVLIGTYSEVSNYYKEKEFGISMEAKTISYSNTTPSIIALSYQLPVVPGNLTFFDVNYAQCHWSTNYGYFFTKDPKYSLTKKYERDIIIPNCPYFNDQIFWTYEVSDFSLHKPPIFIGLTLEDTNNPIKKLGSAKLAFNWTDTDIIQEVPNSTLWIN